MPTGNTELLARSASIAPSSLCSGKWRRKRGSASNHVSRWNSELKTTRSAASIEEKFTKA